MKQRSFFPLPVFLVLLASLLSFPACQKDVSPPLTIIQGRITEYGTDLPIQGVRIYLLCYDGSLFGGSSSNLADSIVTDANGEFHRAYPQADVCGGSYMIIYKEGYYKRDGIGVTTGVNNVNIALDPEAWLKVVTVPDGPNHYEYIGMGGDFSLEAWANQGSKESYFTARGNRDIVIRWGPFDDPSVKFSDTLFLPGHDTTSYTIHY